MRFEHAPGDKSFVDYSDLTMDSVERASRVVDTAVDFVAAMGCEQLDLR
jgi:hypothetical protein